MIDRFLKRREVEAATGLSRSAIYRRMAAGTFPRPRDLGGNTVRWPEAAIAAWQRNHGETSSRPPAPA